MDLPAGPTPGRLPVVAAWLGPRAGRQRSGRRLGSDPKAKWRKVEIMVGRSSNLRRGAVVAGVLLLVVALAGCDIKPRRLASGSTRQVWVTDAAPGVTVELLASETAASPIQTGTTDAKGAYVFYGVAPASSYWVRTAGHAPYATAKEVLGVMAELDQNPSAADYDNWVHDEEPADEDEPTVSTVITPGTAPTSAFGYLPMRDATRLMVSAMVPAGTCTSFGQTDCKRRPTIAIMSMYDLAAPGTGAIGLEENARDLVALGYAVVGVQLRGTHCSGGAWDGTGSTVASDGYDAVEMLARQPFSTGSVASLGFSGPAFHSLPLGAARPPHLTAMVMGGATDFYDLYYPGGMDAFGADGFTSSSWTTNIAFQAAVKPATGDHSVATTIDAIGARFPGGPTGSQAASFAATCTENQDLHLQHSMGRVGGVQHTAIDASLLLGTAGLLRTPGSGRIPMDQTSLADRAARVQVPVFVSSTWHDDAAMGAATFAQLFTSAPAVYGLYANGRHEMPAFSADFPALAGDTDDDDSIAVDLHRFLNLYVARMPVAWDGTTQATAFGDATPSAVASAQATAAQRPVTVVWDRNPSSTDAGDPPTDPPTDPIVTHHTALPGGASTPTGTAAVRLYLQGDGSLGFSAPTVADGSSGSSVTYTEAAPSPARGPANGSTTPWVRPASGAAATFTSMAVSADFGAWIYGPLSADLWIKSTTTDARLQVTFTELRPDGTEVFLQTGWRKASRRQLDARSTTLVPLPTGTTAEPLTPGTWTAVRVPLPTLAHVIELGSKLRITISAPGGDAPGAAFDAAASSTVTVGTSATRPSSLAFSWVTENPPNDQGAADRTALWDLLADRRDGAVGCTMTASSTTGGWWNSNQPCRWGG